jgi:4-amino-4-deoxy-L-arabinose transferase-like glycosyltransferase
MNHMGVSWAIADWLRTPAGRRALLVLIALAFRALALIHGGAVIQPHGDEFYYLEQGTSLAQGLGYPGSFRPPLSPALIGASFLVFGPGLTALRWVQILISLVAVLAVFEICRERFGSRAAFLSGLACAISPGLVHFTHFLWAETLFVTLFMAFVWMMHRYDRGGGVSFLAGAGLSLALAALTKEIVVFFAFLCLPWFLVRAPRAWRKGVVHASIFLVCFLLPVLPWTVRNRTMHGTYVGISNCRWFPIAVGNLRVGDEASGTAERVEFLRQWRGMNDEVDKEAFSRRAALRSIRAQQPMWILRKIRSTALKLFSPMTQEIRFLELGLYPRQMGVASARALVVTSVAGHLLLLTPGLMALWLVRDDWLKWVVLLIVGYSLGVYTVANATARFLVPLLPMFYLYVGPLLTGAGARAARWRRVGALATAAVFVWVVASQLSGMLGPVWRSLGR